MVLKGLVLNKPPGSLRSGWGYGKGETQAGPSPLEKNKIKYEGTSDAQAQAEGIDRSLKSLQNSLNTEPWGVPARLNIETEHQPLSHYQCNEAV